MLQDSTRCLVCGLLGLIPVLGLVFAVAALVFAGKARTAEKRFWNAAKPYRLVGTGVVMFTVVLWIFIAFLVAMHMIQHPDSGGYGHFYGDD
ncbi:MAG TPA: hypothetical protein VN625_02600 [Desulfuromonadaceae bacterium]|nr:hypothetical protein [Desulfuromonadaceae bacterium]